MPAAATTGPGTGEDAVPSGERSPVLLTCFEPFGGQTVNASAAAVEQVAGLWRERTPLVTLTLPVSFLGAPRALAGAVAEHAPRLVVCVGEAGGRAAVGVERVAVNVIDARIADNDGAAPVDVPVVDGGPAAYFSTLPIKACLLAGRRTGAPVEVSGTAGTYVCNATFYALMHLLGTGSAVRGGFVHVPMRPEQVGPGSPALPTDASARALTAIVRAALGTATDVRVSAGSEA